MRLPHPFAAHEILDPAPIPSRMAHIARLPKLGGPAIRHRCVALIGCFGKYSSILFSEIVGHVAGRF